MRISVASLLVVLLSATTSRAQPAATDAARDQARTVARDAARAYDDGDYARALAKFQEAYRTFPSPQLLFNLGQAYKQLARPVEAIEHFQRFLTEGTGAPDDAKAEARKALDELDHQVARIEVTSDATGAEVVVDGRPFGATPLPRPILVAPGPHQVVVQKPGAATFLRRINAVAGATLRIEAELGVAMSDAPPAAVAPPPAPEPVVTAAPAPRGRKLTVLSTTLLVAAPVLVGTGIFFGSQARDDAEYIERHCSAGCAGADIVGRDEDRRRSNLLQWVFIGTGAAALLSGAALYLWDGGGDEPVARAAVGIVPGGAAATVTGRW